MLFSLMKWGGESLRHQIPIYFLNKIEIGAILQALMGRVLVIYKEILEETNEVGQT
jgi:hypothetical protein